eukprot:m.308466 g.308466  ORF g.308466 m.308466 type:complete len:224 (+) comp44041_c0_seq1:40-711(+)
MASWLLSLAFLFLKTVSLEADGPGCKKFAYNNTEIDLARLFPDVLEYEEGEVHYYFKPCVPFQPDGLSTGSCTPRLRSTLCVVDGTTRKGDSLADLHTMEFAYTSKLSGNEMSDKAWISYKPPPTSIYEEIDTRIYLECLLPGDKNFTLSNIETNAINFTLKSMAFCGSTARSHSAVIVLGTVLGIVVLGILLSAYACWKKKFTCLSCSQTQEEKEGLNPKVG